MSLPWHYIPDVAKRFVENVLNNKMPKGLKKYMELELFPQVHMKVGHGISLNSACRWLQKEVQVHFTSKGLVFWWPWQAWCCEVLAGGVPQDNGDALKLAHPICGWVSWEQGWKAPIKLCGMAGGALCSWWDDSSCQWFSCKELGLWGPALTLEEGSRPRSSPEWCDLFNCWVIEECEPESGIWQKLWWVLDWVMNSNRLG